MNKEIKTIILTDVEIKCLLACFITMQELGKLTDGYVELNRKYAEIIKGIKEKLNA
jgi:hypothetical protein